MFHHIIRTNVPRGDNMRKDITDEEIAKLYLFLDLAIKNLLYDMKCIYDGPIKIKDHYAHYIESLLSKAREEMRKIKKEMYDRKIQVVHTGEDRLFSFYKFVLDREEYEKFYHKAVIKKNVEYIINRLH